MVEKPTEGKCSVCGSENLIFNEDGSGRCQDCGRVFRWASEEEISRDEPVEDKTEEEVFEIEEKEDSEPAGKTVKGVSATATPRKSDRISKSKRNGFHPTNKPRSTQKKEIKKGFIWIALTGFILLMAGYGIFYGITSAEEFIGEPIEYNNAFRALSFMMNYIGIVLIGLGLTYGALTADHLEDRVRSWMLAAMAILMGLFLGLGIFTMLTMSSL